MLIPDGAHEARQVFEAELAATAVAQENALLQPFRQAYWSFEDPIASEQCGMVGLLQRLDVVGDPDLQVAQKPPVGEEEVEDRRGKAVRGGEQELIKGDDVAVELDRAEPYRDRDFGFA